MDKKVKILNIEIDNFSMNDLLKVLKKGVVVTPNIDHLMLIQKDIEFYKVYEKADFVVCDSQILYFTSKILGTPIKEKISGSDLLPAFYDYHANNENIKIFLLGAAEGVAKKASVLINKKVGRDIVVGYHSPSFGFEKDENECNEIINIINSTNANVLAVGVGAPKQEKWIMRYKDKCNNIKIFMGIGATIDFEAGNLKRAPKILTKLGFEWLYRLIKEPKRLWKRYLIRDLWFFTLFSKQLFKIYKNPWEK